MGINTTNDISIWKNITSGIYAKYHVQIRVLFVYTTIHKRFVIFTCGYFKLSWNTTALSQSNCRNFSCRRINFAISWSRMVAIIIMPYRPNFHDPNLMLLTGADYLKLTTTENTITYHNTLSWSFQNVFSFSWGHFNSQETLKTMLMQNFGVTNKECYGMLWYFL